MTKKYKILIAILWMLMTAIFWMAFISYIGSLGYYNDGRIHGELIEESVSPNGRWKVRIYNIDVGALGSSYHVKVEDLRGEVPMHDIMFSWENTSGIRWKNNNTVSIYGTEMNVRNGKVIKGRSVSPNKRWKIEVFRTAPVDKRYRPFDAKYFVEVYDLEGEPSKQKMRIENSDIRGEYIRWKSNDTVDVLGKVIDLRKMNSRPRSK